MRVLRTIRGIIGTALTWSLPWAAFGGAMLVAYFTVRRGEIPFESFRTAARVNWILFRVGAEVSTIAGALSGALFASLLASRGGRLTFPSSPLRDSPRTVHSAAPALGSRRSRSRRPYSGAPRLHLRRSSASPRFSVPSPP